MDTLLADIDEDTHDPLGSLKLGFDEKHDHFGPKAEKSPDDPDRWINERRGTFTDPDD